MYFSHKKRTIFVIILAAAWLADRATKFLALALLPASTGHVRGFHLSVHRNYGMAFGILQNHPLVSLFLALTGIGLFALALAKHKEVFLTPGIALLWAGALGNLADRLVYGYVVDWIHFILYINLADIWLGIGALLSAKHFALLER